jgi:hypothetical protein
MSDADNARGLYEDILNYIDEARAFLADGRPQSLLGFDRRIEMFCERILALPETERPPFVAQLEELRARLEELTHQMQSSLNAMQTEMQVLDKRQRALKAYHVPKGDR